VRSPGDLIAVLRVLGVRDADARAAVGASPAAVVERAGTRTRRARPEGRVSCCAPQPLDETGQSLRSLSPLLLRQRAGRSRALQAQVVVVEAVAAAAAAVVVVVGAGAAAVLIGKPESVGRVK
jgi:hypothetical protein